MNKFRRISFNVFVVILFFLFIVIISGCSGFKPIHDPKMSQSEAIMYDDWQSCAFLIKQQVNGFYYGYHKDEMEMKCLTNRGHSILNVVN